MLATFEELDIPFNEDNQDTIVLELNEGQPTSQNQE